MTQVQTNQMMILEGGCYCGNITYHFYVTQPLTRLSVRACNCTFCSKHGVVYTSDPVGKLSIHIDLDEHVKVYQFASKDIDVVFCAVCGVMPFSVTEIDGDRYATINVNTLNEKLPQLDIQIKDFAAASAEDNVKRRKMNWTPVL